MIRVDKRLIIFPDQFSHVALCYTQFEHDRGTRQTRRQKPLWASPLSLEKKRIGSFNDECRNLLRLLNSYFSEDTHVAFSFTREMPVPARAQPPSPHPGCRETKSRTEETAQLPAQLAARRSLRQALAQSGWPSLCAPPGEKKKTWHHDPSFASPLTPVAAHAVRARALRGLACTIRDPDQSFAICIERPPPEVSLTLLA